MANAANQNNMNKFSINQQMKMFPPMVNTLFLEKQIENDMKIIPPASQSPQKETLASKTLNSLEFHSSIEEEMKGKLT